MGNHILCTPCPLVPPNGGSGEGGNVPGALQEEKVSYSRPTVSSHLWRRRQTGAETPARGLEESCHQRTTNTKWPF